MSYASSLFRQDAKHPTALRLAFFSALDKRERDSIEDKSPGIKISCLAYSRPVEGDLGDLLKNIEENDTELPSDIGKIPGIFEVLNRDSSLRAAWIPLLKELRDIIEKYSWMWSARNYYLHRFQLDPTLKWETDLKKKIQ